MAGSVKTWMAVQLRLASDHITIGEDVHFLVTVLKNAEDCCWVITHKDDAEVSTPSNVRCVLIYRTDRRGQQLVLLSFNIYKADTPLQSWSFP